MGGSVTVAFQVALIFPCNYIGCSSLGGVLHGFFEELGWLERFFCLYFHLMMDCFFSENEPWKIDKIGDFSKVVFYDLVCDG
jgi:hypothetical protein